MFSTITPVANLNTSLPFIDKVFFFLSSIFENGEATSNAPAVKCIHLSPLELVTPETKPCSSDAESIAAPAPSPNNTAVVLSSQSTSFDRTSDPITKAFL
ncbi:hypothetical protein D3C76_900930 [compost metagenome]